jgi:hypothetical protein
MSMKEDVRGYMNDKQRRQFDNQDKQLENFQPVPVGGWPIFALWITAIGMGISNGYLFWVTVGGWYGGVIAATAVCLEVTALYCVLNYVRTTGDHQKTLGFWGSVLFGFSLLHAVFGIIHFSGYGQGWWFVDFYTHVIAFPAIMILLAIALSKIIRQHWSAGLFAKIIGERIKGLSDRAEAVIQQDVLLNRAELAALRAKIFEIETQIKEALVPLIQQRINTEKRIENMLRNIGDRTIENEIRQEIEALRSPAGHLTNGNGSSHGIAQRP